MTEFPLLRQPSTWRDHSTAKDKVARRKLCLVRLAGKMNNVPKACRIMRYWRPQFRERLPLDDALYAQAVRELEDGP